MSVDYYQILELDNTATPKEIKSAYRQLAKKYHPDLNPSIEAPEQFKLIHMAYEVLIDPIKKRLYDEIYQNKSSDFDDFIYQEYPNQTEYSSHVKDDTFYEWEEKARAKAEKASHVNYAQFKRKELKGMDFIMNQIALTIAILFFFLLAGFALVFALSIIKNVIANTINPFSIIGSLLLIGFAFYILKQMLVMTKALLKGYKEKYIKLFKQFS